MSIREVTPVVAALPRVTYEARPLTASDISDTAKSLAESYARDTAAGVCVADGLGIRMFIRSGALFVEDGVGDYRRTRRFDKATHGLARVVVIGATGSWTLDALHWCRRLGIGVLVVTPDGTTALESSPRVTDDARLRRAQALAPDLPVGLVLARDLIAHKLVRQAHLLSNRFGEAQHADSITELAELATRAPSIDEVRHLEAEGASFYWQCWAGRSESVPHFTARDRSRVPPHWTRYESRRSVLKVAYGNRKAERPTNALLSYCYALLEAEATLACRAMGLDPGLGMIHKDTRGRQSLALDIMEPIRPLVDSYVLDLLERRTFRKADFTETPEGHCRLRPPLTHDLAETLPKWSKAVAPLAEHVANTLGHSMEGKYEPVTPLSGRARRNAYAQVRTRKSVGRGIAPPAQGRQGVPKGRAGTPWSCPQCGGPVGNQRHVRCDICIAEDPSQSPDLRGRRGAAIASRKRAQRDWELSHPGITYDPELFRRQILPSLEGLPLAAIMAAAGISKSYASQIRAGKFIPQVSTWAALAALIQAQADGISDVTI